MNIAIARIKTAQAVALSNGDSTAVLLFNAVINELTPYARDPYIMPDVLTPPAPAVDVAAMTKDEAHDAVQAGVITREDVVDAGVIAHVDELSPHPDEVQVIESPVAVPAGTDNPPGSSGADAPSEAPVPSAEPEPVVPAADPVTPVIDPAAAVINPDLAVIPPAPEPSVPPVSAGTDGSVSGSPVNQGDSGDEDPTPAEKETIASLDKRLDAIERPGKVSRQ